MRCWLRQRPCWPYRSRCVNWSTGCTVLHHHLWIKNANGANVQDPKATRYKRFMELYRGASNKQNIP